jgi:N-carbamoylputrescine amidase
MFNEHARCYGQADADLIVVPRATGTEHYTWLAAAAMAAIVSGSYVVSSNRVGASDGSPVFGGKGFAVGPDGLLLAETSADRPLVAVTIDPGRSQSQKFKYPCYVNRGA